MLCSSVRRATSIARLRVDQASCASDSRRHAAGKLRVENALRTWSSSSAIGTRFGGHGSPSTLVPIETLRPGCSMSSPAAEAFSVECVPPQSESTKPLKPRLVLHDLGQQILDSRRRSLRSRRCSCTSRPSAGRHFIPIWNASRSLSRIALLGDVDVDLRTAILLIVHGVVLDVGEDVLRAFAA